ncbi:hypothetical protein CHU98_g9276 [Xylaria longipes]|nr:hypothetical protein CHU98_g9276 [Xylaria longipes]
MPPPFLKQLAKKATNPFPGSSPPINARYTEAGWLTSSSAFGVHDESDLTILALPRASCTTSTHLASRRLRQNSELPPSSLLPSKP